MPYNYSMSDILIIGGGIIGLSIAREMLRRGAGRVTVIETGTCAREASWAAAGMLSPCVEAVDSDEFYRLCAASRDMYPAVARELLDETGIDIELDRTGTLDVAFGEEDGRRLLDKCRKQRAAGIAVEALSLEEVLRREHELSCTITIAAHYPDDWQVENRKLLTALLRYAELNDISVRENTEAASVIVENGTARGVQTAAGPAYADHTIIATGAWTSLIKLGSSEMPFDVKPVRGQIVEFQGTPGEIAHVVWSGRGYIVPRRDGRILAGSTSEDAGFDHSVTDEARNGLISMASQIAPLIGTLPVTGHWSGLRPFATDGLPVIGPIAGIEGLTIAAGHYRNGILLAPLTAKLVSDAVLNKEAPAAELSAFSPNRFRSATAV
jgi:glycine oxidase